MTLEFFSEHVIDAGNGVRFAVSENELLIEHVCSESWDGSPALACLPLYGTRGWKLEQRDPVTISPSILCMNCRHHGFIRDGKWVPA